MKKEYKELQNKYGLPSYEALDKDFEIYSISKDEDIIREVFKKIMGVVEHNINFLEDLIQPDSRFYALKEANFIDNNQRLIINNNYNKLMYLNRLSIMVSLNYSEEEVVSFIKKAFEDWQLIKKELLPIINVLKESWLKKTEDKVEGCYFG